MRRLRVGLDDVDWHYLWGQLVKLGERDPGYRVCGPWPASREVVGHTQTRDRRESRGPPPSAPRPAHPARPASPASRSRQKPTTRNEP